MMDKNLTQGSVYAVRSLGTREEMVVSQGTFQGFVSVGTADAMILELGESHGDDAGTLRLIPSHMILFLDVVEAAESEATEEVDQIHYT